MFHRQKEKIKENLQLQFEVLTMIQNRHVGWADTTDDLEAKRQHLEIADRIQQTREHFRLLLEIYDKAIEQSE